MADQPITTLFLDVGGVLLTDSWGTPARMKAAQAFELDFADMDERHNQCFFTYAEGKLSLEDYLDHVVFHARRPFSPSEFIEFMLDQSQPLPLMMDFIRALKARHGLKVVVLSNEFKELTLHRVNKFGLRDFVDAFIFSCFVGMLKPDRNIYRLALNVAMTAPEQAAYVDDRSMLVEVGRGLGLHGIHHTDCQSTRAALAALGLEA